VLEHLDAALGRIADALSERSREAADGALRELVAAEAAETQLSGVLSTAGEAARLSPQRRGSLSELDRYAVAAGQLGRVIGNVRALARGATRAVNLDDAVPPEAIEATERLAACIGALADYLNGGDPEPAREHAVAAAALANAVLEATGNLSALHIVGQIRLAAVDLLRATALEREEAQQLVRAPVRT
jgi:hypothetical protein